MNKGEMDDEKVGEVGYEEAIGDVIMDVVVFFFKQKTAYEIYQCDWSSDVCSSNFFFFKDDSESGAFNDKRGNNLF